MKKKFKIKGLDCANCAVELERKIRKLDGIDNVIISFITQKLEIEYNETRKEEIIKNIKRVIKKEETDVIIEEV